MLGKNFKQKIIAPEIEPRYRHSFIMDSFDKLASGEYLELQNNHDPMPLRYQFMQERADQFSWEYMEEGPAVWKIAIGKL